MPVICPAQTGPVKMLWQSGLNRGIYNFQAGSTIDYSSRSGVAISKLSSGLWTSYIAPYRWSGRVNINIGASGSLALPSLPSGEKWIVYPKVYPDQSGGATISVDGNSLSTGDSQALGQYPDDTFADPNYRGGLFLEGNVFSWMVEPDNFPQTITSGNISLSAYRQKFYTLTILNPEGTVNRVIEYNDPIEYLIECPNNCPPNHLACTGCCVDCAALAARITPYL